MYELHENEQYFFTPGTLGTLTRFLARYDRVAVLGAPMLGRALAEAGRKVPYPFGDHRPIEEPSA